MRQRAPTQRHTQTTSDFSLQRNGWHQDIDETNQVVTNFCKSKVVKIITLISIRWPLIIFFRPLTSLSGFTVHSLDKRSHQSAGKTRLWTVNLDINNRSCAQINRESMHITCTNSGSSHKHWCYTSSGKQRGVAVPAQDIWVWFSVVSCPLVHFSTHQPEDTLIDINVHAFTMPGFLA